MFSGLSQHEARKLATLDLLRRDDKPRDQILGEFARLASTVMGVSGCFVTIFDPKYQYIKYSQNIPWTGTKIPVEDSMCQHSVYACESIICSDTRQDHRFNHHPLAQTGAVIFYAASPLKTHDEFVLGTLCVTEQHPVTPTQAQIDKFLHIASLASAYLEAWYSVGQIDALTGLPNRQNLLNELEKRVRSKSEAPLALFIFDCIEIPRLYELSRYLGVAAVETMLRNFGALLRVRLDLDISVPLYAFATGRFAILVNASEVGAIIKKAELMPPTLANITGDIELKLHTHTGYTIFSPAQTSGQEVIRHVISALHEAIRQGAPVKAFDPILDRKRNDDFRLLYDISEAIKAPDQLYLMYQPKISLHTGETIGAEALLRWEHPERGNIPPSTIIALVEKTTLMMDITQWVIREVIRQTTIWRRNGIYLPISINVTVSDFSVPGFASALEKQVLEAGLACRDFRIECLETDKVLESEVALMELDLLKAKGFLILLDDFGAGYSNINYLRRLPIDVIKLDRSLISQITHDEASLVIVRNVIVMLKELDYEVLAEGVEDKATARILKDFGCDEVQGFYFSRPLRPEDIPAWMGRRNLLEGIE